MKKESATVKSNEMISEGIRSLVLEVSFADETVPGQFVNLYSRDRSRLLPRPISVCTAEDGCIRLVFRIAGDNPKTGAVGGGGLGKLALSYGYQRYRFAVLYLAVIVLVIITQVIQSFGTWLARKSDKRLKEK